MPYILHLTYQVDDAAREAVKPMHREYLRGFYDAGQLLLSGPRADLTGGVIVTADVERDVVDALIADDPFVTEGVATYDVVEFTVANVRPGLLD